MRDGSLGQLDRCPQHVFVQLNVALRRRYRAMTSQFCQHSYIDPFVSQRGYERAPATVRRSLV